MGDDCFSAIGTVNYVKNGGLSALATRRCPCFADKHFVTFPSIWPPSSSTSQRSRAPEGAAAVAAFLRGISRLPLGRRICVAFKATHRQPTIHCSTSVLNQQLLPPMTRERGNVPALIMPQIVGYERPVIRSISRLWSRCMHGGPRGPWAYCGSN